MNEFLSLVNGLPTEQVPVVTYAPSFAQFASAQVSTMDSGVTSTTFTTISNSPAFTFTPTISGTYKIYASLPLQNNQPSSGNGPASARIFNTSANATLLYEQQGFLGAEEGVDLINNYQFTSIYVASVYTLTAGVSYVFDVQTKVASGEAVYVDGNLCPYYLFAEGVGGVVGAQTFFISSAIGSGVYGVTSYINGPGSPALTITPQVTGTYRVWAGIKVAFNSGAPIVQMRINNTSGGATLLAESGSYWYPNTVQAFATCPIEAVYNLTAGQTYVFDYQVAISNSGSADIGGVGESAYMFCELTSTMIGNGAPTTVVSGSSGGYTASGGPNDVTNLSVEITNSGLLPVDVYLQNDGSGNPSFVSTNESSGSFGEAYIYFLRNGTVIGQERIEIGTTPAGSYLYVPASSYRFTDLNPPGGVNTYSIQCVGAGDNSVSVAYCVLVAREVSSISLSGSGNGITDLTGDVTATGPGSVPATISVGAVTDTKASLANKPACAVVATTNQALSGIPANIDGITTLVNGSLILLTAQSTASQNGPWVINSGSWTRPTWYPSGGTTQAVQYSTTFIRLGTTYQGSTWRLTTSGVTIDTSSQTWLLTPIAINATTAPNALTQSQSIINAIIFG